MIINRHSVSLSLLAALVVLAGLTSAAFAQDDSQKNQPVRGMFVTLPGHLHPDIVAPSSATLPSWNGSILLWRSELYLHNMVGTAPSTNTSTTITTYIIPVKIVITNRSGSKTTFDPSHVLSNGNSVTTNTLDSPIFESSTTYTQGGVDVGTTQYIDAFQRANFWGTVKTHTNYHLLLGTTVLPEQTLSPSRTYGKTGSPFGFTAGEVDINWFDAQLPGLMSKLGIQPNTFPIFLTL